LLFGLLMLALSSTTYSNHDNKLILVADEWCPYNCEAGSDQPGFIIELAQKAFSSLDITVQYKSIPWTRAIIEVEQGISHGLVGAGRDEVPSFIFPDIEQGIAAHTFFVMPNTNWQYQGYASLKRIRLGVIQDYSYGNLLNEYIIPNQPSKNVIELSGNLALSRLVEMLRLSRIDALIEDHLVFEHHLFKENAKHEFVSAGIAFEENVFIAFSPALAESRILADHLSKRMRALRKSGELATILKKYGVVDWASSATKRK